MFGIPKDRHEFRFASLNSLRNPLLKASLTALLVCEFCLLQTGTSQAEIVAFLTEARPAGGERFESDLVMSGTAGMIGDTVELINLDVFFTTVNAAPLTDFTKVRFDAASRFLPWQDDQQFGMTPGFESVVVLDSFATVSAEPFTITDTDPFTIGTLTFDYSSFGLQEGDTIRLDILGRNDGSQTRTTSVAIRPSGSALTTLVDPDFSTPAGSEQSLFTITAIPEPGAGMFLAALGVAVCARRRRK